MPATRNTASWPVDGTATSQSARENPQENGSIHGSEDSEKTIKNRKRWRFGILEDAETDEVPGSVLLLSKTADHNIPLGMRNKATTSSNASLSLTHSGSRRSATIIPVQPPPQEEKKRTRNGKIILEPQPEESKNDPLNWSTFRKDAALISLSLFCFLGGGMTPILAAGFTNVSETFDVSTAQVARTTGLYMMGLGVGSVVASPTAILYGKRPVYLVGSVCFSLSAVWCALSPNYASLCVARVVQGIAVSPVECLPSATICEIYFLHQKAYRLGIYTLLLLGGKNLVPLASAAIIQSLGWRWVFWVVAIVVGVCGILLFFFVPETFWDRTPMPHKPNRRPTLARLQSRPSQHTPRDLQHEGEKLVSSHPVPQAGMDLHNPQALQSIPGSLAQRRGQQRARFAISNSDPETALSHPTMPSIEAAISDPVVRQSVGLTLDDQLHESPMSPAISGTHGLVHVADRPEYSDYFDQELSSRHETRSDVFENVALESVISPLHYTKFYRTAPPKSFVQQLKPYSGRLTNASWFRVMLRPWVLFAYPAILWSSAVYALSVGWLIILSESVSTIYRSKTTYHFSAIQTGLIYISPFVGGILGTVIAGKVSDLIVRYMARHNDGIYEPEFRLVMAIPVAICTTIGLMGFGWSAEVHDAWIVPTVFFGIISFGCTLGSTTAITFALDSYRQYAGEALVTLNWSKNVFDGLVFSLFFNNWLDSDGSKKVFLTLGGIQLFFMCWTIPLYIYGKRLRMWTVRRNLMARLS